MIEKKTIKKIIKLSCIVQTVNASIDLILWQTTGFLVPCWTISALIIGYTTILLSYDKL